ncbi:hypothetical protein ACNQGL_08690 [Flavobacterium sp. LB3P21]|uniref:hypothetical protein n=1 Tax=Flavobacterium sp. LB3P21 TaxID=3401719 RepID=UPI003AAA4E31
MTLNLKNVFLLVFVCLSSKLCISQTKEEEPKAVKKFDMAIDGMLGISYNGKALGINVGGPSLKLKWRKDLKIGVGAFPSLLVMDKKAAPRLAVSPIIEYKKWMVIAPYYGYDSSDRIIWTYGLGYKFY